VTHLMAAASDAPTHNPRPGITVIGPVSSSVVIDFLGEYLFHENSRDLDSDLISKYIHGRRADGELTHFRVAIMGRAKSDGYLGSADLGTGAPIGCINRAKLRSVGATYADIKTLMSRSDRAIDMPIRPEELNAMSLGELAALRNLPNRRGQGDGSGLLLVYPVSKDSIPLKSATTREPLEAKAHLMGIGLVFPESESQTAGVDYVTADVASMKVDVDAPDESDELDEAEIEVRAA
jgi:hypothetical protein